MAPVNGKTSVGTRLLVALLHVLGYVYDFLTSWIWLLFQCPCYKLACSQRVKAKPLLENDPSSPYRCVDHFDKLLTYMHPTCTDIDAAFRHSVELHGPLPCLGTRVVMSKEKERQPDGKVFIKEVLGDYVWQTYDEVNARVTLLAAGLKSIGLTARSHLCLYAETRADWLLMALACFRANITIVTLYATLGEEAVILGINESDAKYVVTSEKLIEKFKTMMPRLTQVQHLILLDQGSPKQQVLVGMPETVQIHTMSSIEYAGTQANLDVRERILPDDIAVIMYTSGSSAAPKGVMISHLNILACCAGQQDRVRTTTSDVYVAYLPLAHIYEMFCEILLLIVGARIGYSSPITLTDKSSGIKKGCRGDLAVLQPTLMAVIPVILDRIRKAIQDDVASRGSMQRALFQFAYEYKRRHYLAGYNTPLMDSLVFSKIGRMMGGKFRILMSGGAPLAADTQLFLSLCLCLTVYQGYGLTESCGAGSAQEMTDRSTGRSGHPISCNDFMLVDWPEGGYMATDKPRPRGELWIGGSNVAMGYFKDPAKTAEAFRVIAGQRWVATGDVAEFDPDGCIRIIDRKKDLVKLQTGEYIAPGKIETILKQCPLIDNVFICARSTQTYVICFIVPNPWQLAALAEDCGIEVTTPLSPEELEKLCAEQCLVTAALRIIQDCCVLGKLVKMEIPQKVHMCAEPWTPESNLVTESFKLKRWNLEAHFKEQISRMYDSTDG